MKHCSKCERSLPLDRFVFRKSKGRHSSRCRECISKQNKAYYAKNGDKVRAQARNYSKRMRKNPEYLEKEREYSRKRYRKLKLAALKHFGMACACCGEAELDFLTLDHKNVDGKQHREQINRRNIYEWLKNNNYKCDFELQTLCYNCNYGSYRSGGICPHKRSEGSEAIRKE